MNNLMSRDEFLHQTNEGFIKDTVKKGINKIKEIFSIGMKKIKNFIAIFDNEGNVLPVVSPQAVIDNFSGKSNIKVYASVAMSDSVESAGGKGCANKAPEMNDDEVYDFGPDGPDFADWTDEEEYKNTIEYKNLMSIPGIVNECYDSLPDETKKLFESWEDVKKERVSYHKTGGEGELRGLPHINVDRFKEIIEEMIDERVFGEGDFTEDEMFRNILVFGAPGIGKSTVPNVIINEYNNKINNPSKMMSLVTVDCANIAVGDFVMPTMPEVKDVQEIILNNGEAFPQAKEYLDNLTPEQNAKISAALSASKQYEAGEAPKAWLPSYKATGNTKIDQILDAYANGGVYTNKATKETFRTGNGGIIMFDELLRSDPNVFKQLMIFLLTRQFDGWTLGSKWVIIACSNRPCDDSQVDEVWSEWNGCSAAKDRFERMFHLDPNPAQWKEWARRKGCDELILKFIFEESSKVGNEYPRWHSMLKNGEKGAQVIPILPRGWESAFNMISKFKKKHNIEDISQMKIKEVKDCLQGKFDESFIIEFTDWLEDHMNSVSLDEIIKDPINTYLPKKFNGNDEALAEILIKDLWEQFENKFKDNLDECTDDILKNIAIWFGINYKTSLGAFQSMFLNPLENIMKSSLTKHMNLFLTLLAAWPCKDDVADCIEYIENNMKALPEGETIKELKDIMKKYFPWRLDDDGSIKYFDDLKID